MLVLERVVRFARATGRTPSRRGNPHRYLADCDRWLRRHDGDSAAARVGALLRRVPALDLGEVTSVQLVRDDDALARLERVVLPRSPAPGAPVRGLEMTPIETPEALAAERARMNHCVATWLPRVLEGDTFIYSASAAGERVTLAVTRDRGGILRIAEARRSNDRQPTPIQRRLLEKWLGLQPWQGATARITDMKVRNESAIRTRAPRRAGVA
ncbi:PcfJ domain-containing protein [Anaeromyxobacter oryzae]|uniref:PcfJ domain-containing protein n=1 Tax=Anaeromyxobacter oryzae TaxID=2918170 RepID=UPI0020BE8279|nr:PcfJ domain-containing protein [Anaeromyxobacter oryzae]